MLQTALVHSPVSNMSLADRPAIATTIHAGTYGRTYKVANVILLLKPFPSTPTNLRVCNVLAAYEITKARFGIEKKKLSGGAEATPLGSFSCGDILSILQANQLDDLLKHVC